MTWDRVSIPELAPQLTHKFEGNVLRPYKDSSHVWTIGVGSTVMPDGSVVTGGSPGITLAQSMELLKNQQMRWAPIVASSIHVPISETCASVLIDFVHNLGPNALPNSTLARMLNLGRLDLAATQLALWVFGGGQRVLGLMRRREAERQIMLEIADLDTAYNSAWSMSESDLNQKYAEARAALRSLPT